MKKRFGYAFVQFDNAESATAAIAESKHQIAGKTVKAKAAHSQQQTPSVRGPSKQQKLNAASPINKLNEDHLRKIFKRLNIVSGHGQPQTPLVSGQFKPNKLNAASPINKLNEHCLRKIFKYLRIFDLLSTADVCNQFRKVAKDLIEPVNYLNLKMNSNISLPLLRLFGPEIESIELDFGLFSEYGIDLLLNRIAALGSNPNSKLTKIIISGWNIKGKFVNRLKPIFSRITSLSMDETPKHDGTVAEMLGVCSELKELELNYIHFGEISKIRFPKLEKFVTFETPQLRDYMVDQFLSSHPQLKSISMNWKTALTSKAVRNLNSNIEKLELLGDIKLTPNLNELNGLKNLKSLNLCCFSLSGEKEVKSLAKKGLSIEELHLSGLDLSRTIVNGIKLLKHLKKITLTSGEVDDNDLLVEMVKAHPRLKSITSDYFAEEIGIKRIKEMVKLAPELEHIEFHQEDCVVIGSKDFESILKLVQSRPNKTKLKIVLSGYGCKSKVPQILKKESREWLEFDVTDDDYVAFNGYSDESDFSSDDV